jgi:uncharacterized protein YegL
MTENELLLEEEPTDDDVATSQNKTGTLTAIVEILDRSGSMAEGNFIDEVRNGYNAYIKANRELPGMAVVFTVLFDTQIDLVVNGMDVNDVPDLTPENYFPRGGTSLNDAVMFAIEAVDAWIKEQPEGMKPNNVVVEIQTDGEENSSARYNRHNAAAMSEFREIVKGKEAAGWVFSYVGTSGDAVGAAVNLGVSMQMAQRTSANMHKGATANNAYFASKVSSMSYVRGLAGDAGAEEKTAAYCFSDEQKKQMLAPDPTEDPDVDL